MKHCEWSVQSPWWGDARVHGSETGAGIPQTQVVSAKWLTGDAVVWTEPRRWLCEHSIAAQCVVGHPLNSAVERSFKGLECAHTLCRGCASSSQSSH